VILPVIFNVILTILQANGTP